MGWKYRGIEGGETVACHMYRMALMCLLFDGDHLELDMNRCIKMALVHDLAEAIVGDLTPDDPIPVDAKHRLETVQPCYGRLIAL